MNAMPEYIKERRKQSRRSGGEGRRRYPRVDLCLEGFYCSTARALMGVTEELNLRGLFLRTRAPDPAGVRAQIRLITPGVSTMLRLPVRVCWSNGDPERGPTGMAVKFEGIEDWQLKRLAALLLQRAGWQGLGLSSLAS